MKGKTFVVKGGSDTGAGEAGEPPPLKIFKTSLAMFSVHATNATVTLTGATRNKHLYLTFFQIPTRRVTKSTVYSAKT